MRLRVLVTVESGLGVGRVESGLGGRDVGSGAGELDGGTSGTERDRTKKGARPCAPFEANLAVATSSWPPFSSRLWPSSPSESPLSVVSGLRIAPHDPAHSAAWHVGPDFCAFASRAYSRHATRPGRPVTEKKGCPIRTPQSWFEEFSASSRPSSSRRPRPSSSPLFSPQVVVTQPPTDHLAVTTGGLSHPPSYQM